MAINKETQKSVSVILSLDVYNLILKISKLNKRSVSSQIALYAENSSKKEKIES